MPRVTPILLERLRDLALVDLDALLGPAPPEEARDLLRAYVADLEDAVLQARDALRAGHAELGAGVDPLGYLELGPERRSQAGEAGVADASARLAERAAKRRALARLDEMVRGVLPRLLEADRRFVALGL